MAGRLGAKHGVIRTIAQECIHCGKTYQALGRNRRDGPHPRYYCSHVCADAARRQPIGLLTAEELREIINYDPDTGTFTWLEKRGRIEAGSVAGYINTNGYRSICIDYDYHPASRLAFLYMKGEWPPFEMDHINCIRHDDRWSNLRPATSAENKENTQIRTNKYVSLKGVSFHKHSNKYRAHITINGRQISLGYFHDPEDAHTAYVKAAKETFGKFARAK